jgi:hydrogenase maturation protease
VLRIIIVNDKNLLVLGIGNTLLCDEGAGIHALRLLEAQAPGIAGAAYVDGGTLSFTLATYIEDCDHLIVFDAAELRAPPGTVASLVGAEMDAFLGAARRSPHEVGLLDLFDIARLTGALPERRALIGIQPVNLDWSTRPSAAVEQALPHAVEAATDLLQRWRLLGGEAAEVIVPRAAAAAAVPGEPAGTPR